MNLGRGILIFLFVFAACLLLFNVRFIGFASNIPSSVTIELPVSVNVSLFDGSTTDFSNMTNAHLENIPNLIFEKVAYGKIFFNEPVNLKQGAVNRVVQCNDNVHISNNYIEIDTTKLSGLENAATLYLYNLNFSNPRIMRNGAVCSDTICQKINYSSGMLAFRVTEFTNYSAEETPEITGTSATGGGGVPISSFSIDQDLIKVSVKQGENAKEFLVIRNIGNRDISIRVDSLGLDKFIILSDGNFVLKAGESKSIWIDLSAKENEVADSYLGKIIISGAGIKKAIGVIFEVKEKNPLFDVKTEILNSVLKSGEKIRTNIKIVNMGDLEHIDVTLYTAIKSFDDEVLAYNDESIAVDKELSVNRSMRAPMVDGKYVFYSRVSYRNISASSSGVFEVSNISSESSPNPIMANKNIIVVAILLVIIIAIWIYLQKHKRKNGLN